MLTVASVPSAHPYVAAIVPDVPADAAPGAGIVRLPDPTPVPDPGDPAVWWPPRILRPDWVRDHADAVDLVHVHFGFEAYTPDELRDWVAALRAARLPLVLTVHDLANPHLAEQDHHLATLGVLVPAATAVITLTDEAAATIRERWGVEATVIPHPALASDAEMARADEVRAGRSGAPRIGLPLGSLRAGTDPTPWLAALVAAADEAGAQVEATVEDTVDSPLLDRIAAALPAPHALRRVPRLPAAELADWVAGLDVLALPYRHGTHSGWLEHAWDLGTSVLAPRVGAFAGQHRDERFFADFAPDGAGLGEALRGLVAARVGTVGDAPGHGIGRPAWGDAAARQAFRAAQLEEVRRAHAEVYGAALSR